MPKFVGFQTMRIIVPYGITFDPLGVYSLAFYLLFKSCSTYCVEKTRFRRRLNHRVLAYSKVMYTKYILNKVKWTYWRMQEQTQSPKKLLLLFSIDNSIANISLYALSWPKLNFGYYLIFEISFALKTDWLSNPI